MILLRQRMFSKKKGESIFLTQPGILTDPDIVYKDGIRLKDGSTERSDAYDKLLELRESRSKDYQNLKRKTGTAVEIDKKGRLQIDVLHGREKDGHGRRVFNAFVSTKSPKEAYRDYLRSMDQRLKLNDFIPDGPSSLSNKEIKDAIRKGVRRYKIRKAAPWVIGGTIATGTAVGIMASKKKKKSKKKEK